MLWSNSASDLKDPVVENTKAVGLERVLTEIHTDSGEHGSSPFPSPAAPQRLADQAGKANADGLPVVGLVSPGGRRGAAKSASLWRWESLMRRSGWLRMIETDRHNHLGRGGGRLLTSICSSPFGVVNQIGHASQTHKERLIGGEKGEPNETLRYAGTVETYRCRYIGDFSQQPSLDPKSALHPRGRQAGARRNKERLI